MADLSPEERAFYSELSQMIDAYDRGEQGSAKAVAKWFRVCADKLDPDHSDEFVEVAVARISEEDIDRG